MRNWEDYKKHAKAENETVKEDIEVMETLAGIIGAMIERRKALGLSQRELAELCGLPQSSVARIEACIVKPNVETMLKMMKPLGLTLAVQRE